MNKPDDLSENQQHTSLKLLNSLFDITAKVALHLSSAFFISLSTFLLYPNRNPPRGMLFYTAMIVLIVFLYAAKKFKKLDNVLLWIGSIAYFVFLASIIFEWTLLGAIYETYGKKIEVALNQVLVGSVLYIIALAILGLVLLYLYFALAKLVKGTSLEIIAQIAGSLFLIAFIAVFYIDKIFPALSPFDYAVDQAHYFVPFLGFSLAYLHGNFLISNTISLLSKKKTG